MSHKVRLARWDNNNFTSAGRWLVRAVPGLLVFNSGLPGRPWRLHALKNHELDTLDGVRRSTEKVWPNSNPDIDFPEARLFLEQNPKLWQEGFASLGEARIALGEALYAKDKPESQLGSLLGQG